MVPNSRRRDTGRAAPLAGGGHAGRTLFLTLAFLLLAACSPAGHPSSVPLRPAAQPGLAAILAELDALQAPTGTDRQVFSALKSALAGQLRRQELRTASTPPQGAANAPLLQVGNDGGRPRFTWHYRNTGDYNQDGTVGISDVTPLAMHFGEEVPPDDTGRLTIQAVVDGSGNGRIGIEDVTPIAINFRVNCSSYRIENATATGGPWTPLDTVLLGDGLGDGRLRFEATVDQGAGAYYRVVPLDGEGTPGEPSNSVHFAPQPPEITGVSPLTAFVGSEVQFSAAVSGSLPMAYSWEFADAGTPAQSALAQPVLAVTSTPGDYPCILSVTNAYGSDSLEFTFAVTLHPPDITEVNHTAAHVGETMTFSAVVLGDEPFTYMWEFGGGVDPASATEPAPVLDAVAAGSYEGDLTVANPAGQDTFHFSYSVLPAGDPPVIESVSPTSGDAGTQVIVSAIVAGTPPFTYSWDFDGAGTPDDPTAESPSVALVNTAGIYSCTLEVTNTCGSDTMDFGFEVLTSFKGVMVVVDSGGAQDPPDDVGSYCRLIAADGRPAIGYRNSTRSRLQYVRANDAYGTTWPAAKKIVVSSHDAGSWMFMALVGGRPAIAYYNDTDDDLMFIAAEDAAGDAWWAAPVTVDSDRTTGRHTCLTVVAGRPAITCYSDTISSLKYVRAANPSGTAWNSPLVLDEGSCGVFNSLTIVNGNPAVSYRHYGADELRYLRAADEGGVVWPDTPTVVESSHDPWYTCLLVLGETPAVIYQNDPDGHLMFVRAKDANGDSWGQPLTLDDGGASGADTGQYVSGCLVQGLPAAAYLAGSPDGDLMYVVAKDQLGNSWNLPVRVDTGGGNWVGQYASLAVISGHPAIAYYDMTAGVLKYVIANDAYGLDWPEEV